MHQCSGLILYLVSPEKLKTYYKIQNLKYFDQEIGLTTAYAMVLIFSTWRPLHWYQFFMALCH